MRTVLVVLGPLLLSLAVLVLFVPARDWDGIGKALLLLSMLWVLPASFLIPVLLFNPSDAPSDSEDGGGGGAGPPPEPISPAPGGGGIPLPDAGQSRDRIRDHARRKRHSLRPRRTEPEPGRAPVRKFANE